MSHKCKILLLLGFVFFLSGLSLLTSNVPDAAFKSDPSVKAHVLLVGITGAAWIFTLSGLTGIISSFTKRYDLGYLLLMGLSMWWGLLYIVSWVSTGYWRSIWGCTLYFLIAGVLWITSKWPEPAIVTVVTPEEEHLFSFREDESR